MTQLLPPKKEVALALLERSNVDVYLDPRATGVVVPAQFRKEPRLILKIGLNMPVPIHDLHVDDDTMSCTLSFNRSPFYCVVPWSSVFAMVGEDGRGMVWPDDVPQELAVKVVDPNDPHAGPTSPIGPTGRLSAVESVGSSSALSSPGSAASAGLGRRNGRSRIAGTDDAPASVDASSTGGASRGKRKKKKEEEGTRPLLVAVPREPDANARTKDESAADSDQPHEDRQAPEPRRALPPRPKDGVSPVAHAPPQAGRSGPRQPVQQPVRRPPPVRPPDGEARPKRELPPYLRVVK